MHKISQKTDSYERLKSASADDIKLTLSQLLTKAHASSEHTELLLILRELDFIYGHILGHRIAKLRRALCISDKENRKAFIAQEAEALISYIYFKSF